MKVEFREINEDDEELIWNIVYVTADMEKSGETLEQAKQNPDRRRYICDWGKPFDYGIIAQTSGADSIFVGAAWMRLLSTATFFPTCERVFTSRAVPCAPIGGSPCARFAAI